MTPPQSELCDVCEEIDFNALLQHKKSRSINLGRWTRIQDASYCPFCRLVVRAIRSKKTPNLHDRTVINLDNHWPTWELCIAQSEHEGDLRAALYTNRFDLKSARKRYPCKYERQLIIRWEEGANFAQIQLIADQEAIDRDGLHEYQFLGREVRTGELDFELVNKWLNLCENHHGRSCREPGEAAYASRSFLADTKSETSSSSNREGSPGTQPLRFIDVNKMCIVPGSASSTYAIMSYAWGEHLMNRQMPRTLEKHKESERRLGYIPLPKNLPRTISDSIEVARALNYQFLWNDALCICQDDEKERNLHITQMDAIYSNADLTIVAGTGLHADSGLPGISAPRKKAQKIETVRGLPLANVLPTYNQLHNRRSLGNSLPINLRGWTFQEKIMSRRVLLFTDYQLYFRCKNANWAEDIIMETNKLSKSVQRRSSPFAWVADRLNSMDTGVNAKDGVMAYARRALARPSEIRPDLGYFPTYITIIENYVPREFTNPTDRLMAISGVLRTLRPHLGHFFEGLPSAYFRQALLWRPSPFSRLARQPKAGSSWSWAGWEFDKRCIWSQDDAIMRPSSRTWELDGDKRSISNDLKTSGDSMAAFTKSHRRIIYSSKTEAFPSAAPDVFRRYSTLLALKTVIPTFNVRPVRGHQSLKPSFYEQHKRSLVDDVSGRCVGFVIAAESLSNPEHRSHRDFLILSWSRGMHDVPVHEKYVPIERGAADENGQQTTHQQPSDEWTVANVLLVRWDDDNIAQRVGIGKIIWTALPKRSWTKAFQGANHGKAEWVFLG